MMNVHMIVLINDTKLCATQSSRQLTFFSTKLLCLGFFFGFVYE